MGGKGGDMRALAREYDKREDEIREVVKKYDGNIKSAGKELSIAESTLRGVLKRWEKRDKKAHRPTIITREDGDKPGGKVDQNNDLYAIVDQALAQESLEMARAFWLGVKAGKGVKDYNKPGIDN